MLRFEKGIGLGLEKGAQLREKGKVKTRVRERGKVKV